MREKKEREEKRERAEKEERGKEADIKCCMIHFVF